MSRRRSLQGEVSYHSRSTEEPNAVNYKNEFYFEFINKSKVFLLIYNSGIIKSNE